MHKCVHIFLLFFYVYTDGDMCYTIIQYTERGADMAYNESSYKAANAYKKQNIKRVPLDMQNADYEQLKAAADACGEKVNEYIKNAIRERMERSGLVWGRSSGISTPADSAK